MVEALWSVEFKSNLQMIGSGIVVLETGRVFGGDSGMIYIGSYKVVGDKIKAILRIQRYANVPGIVSVTGLDDYELELEGKVDPKHIVLQGRVVGAPHLQMSVHGVRRADLP